MYLALGIPIASASFSKAQLNDVMFEVGPYEGQVGRMLEPVGFGIKAAFAIAVAALVAACEAMRVSYMAFFNSSMDGTLGFAAAPPVELDEAPPVANVGIGRGTGMGGVVMHVRMGGGGIHIGGSPEPDMDIGVPALTTVEMGVSRYDEAPSSELVKVMGAIAPLVDSLKLLSRSPSSSSPSDGMKTSGKLSVSS